MSPKKKQKFDYKNKKKKINRIKTRLISAKFILFCQHAPVGQSTRNFPNRSCTQWPWKPNFFNLVNAKSIKKNQMCRSKFSFGLCSRMYKREMSYRDKMIKFT